MTFIVVQYCTVLDLRNKLKEAFVMGQSCCTYENSPNTWDQPFLWSRIIWYYCHYVGIQVVRKNCWRLWNEQSWYWLAYPSRLSVPFTTFVLYLYCNWEQCKWFLSIKYKWKSSLKCNRLLNFVDIYQFYISL